MIIDDQLHMIYRFTYDGKLVHSKGQLGVRVVANTSTVRRTSPGYPTDLLHHDGYGGTRVVKYDANDNFIMDWGQPPKIRGTGPTMDTSTASRSAPTPAFLVDRGHARCRSSTRTGSSSICGR